MSRVYASWNSITPGQAYCWSKHISAILDANKVISVALTGSNVAVDVSLTTTNEIRARLEVTGIVFTATQRLAEFMFINGSGNTGCG